MFNGYVNDDAMGKLSASERGLYMKVLLRRKWYWLLLSFGIVFSIFSWRRSLRSKQLPHLPPGEVILPVERIWQRKEGIQYPNSACGPTTAAMVTNYLIRENRLRYEEISSSRLVNDLYREMGTMPWGTSSRRWRRRMNRFLNMYATENQWRVKQIRATHHFPLYVESIQRQTPVILRFTFNLAKNSFASHHYVVGVGYRMDEDGQFMAVLDPDGGKRNERVHWLKWSEHSKYMKLLYISE